MMFFVGVLLFFMLVYSELIFLMGMGWKKLKPYQLPTKIDYSQYDFFTTVVIPIRNEEKQISDLLSALFKQTYPKELFEVIFVNDNSIDQGKELVEAAISDRGNFRIIDSEGEGKKYALKQGIDKAMGQLIISLDADCAMGPNWLKSLCSYYQQYKPKMIVGPVAIHSKGLFAQLQSLEFLSLASCTAACLGWKHPIMANGANLVYERSLFYEWQDPFNSKEMSGDDMFLLHKVKRKYRMKIHFIRSVHAQVRTKACRSLLSFFRQRKRWVSKSFSYTDTDTIIVALVVLLANLAIIAASVAYFVDAGYLALLLFLMGLKALTDFIMILKAARFYRQKRFLFWFIPMQFIYPIYVLVAVCTGWIGGKKWA